MYDIPYLKVKRKETRVDLPIRRVESLAISTERRLSRLPELILRIS